MVIEGFGGKKRLEGEKEKGKGRKSVRGYTDSAGPPV